MNNVSIRMVRKEFSENEATIDNTYFGKLYEDADGSMVVSYDELDQDTNSITRVKIIFNNDKFFMDRCGNISFDVSIKDGRYIYETAMNTPYGDLPVLVESKSYNIKEYENNFIIELFYGMIISGERVDDVNLTIFIDRVN